MAEGESEQVKKLKSVCHQAFQLYPNSCSHAVTHVIKQYNPSQHFMTANQMVHEFARNPEWREVPLTDVAALSNQGVLVVGGLVGKEHGHVIVVFPGAETPAGGFNYTNRNGDLKTVRRRGCYPRAMSTSMGIFPGARSNGDKTVWDPWANDEEFKKVRFWRYVGEHDKPKHRQKDEAQKYRNPSEEIWI